MQPGGQGHRSRPNLAVALASAACVFDGCPIPAHETQLHPAPGVVVPDVRVHQIPGVGISGGNHIAALRGNRLASLRNQRHVIEVPSERVEVGFLAQHIGIPMIGRDDRSFGAIGLLL